MLAAWTVLTTSDGAVVVESQSAALSLPAALAVSVLGLGGVRVGSRAGFPGMLEPSVSIRERVVVPGVLGGAAGVVLSLLDVVVPLGIPHVPWPMSVAFYAYGAVFTEIAFRLMPLPAAAWLGGRVGGPRGASVAFWAVALLTSLVEPVGVTAVVEVSGVALLAARAVTFLVNMEAAYMLRRQGFLAALITRVVFYLVWHVVYGGVR